MGVSGKTANLKKINWRGGEHEEHFGVSIGPDMNNRFAGGSS
jgi:hypothetical protein